MPLLEIFKFHVVPNILSHLSPLYQSSWFSLCLKHHFLPLSNGYSFFRATASSPMGLDAPLFAPECNFTIMFTTVCWHFLFVYLLCFFFSGFGFTTIGFSRARSYCIHLCFSCTQPSFWLIAINLYWTQLNLILGLC